LQRLRALLLFYYLVWRENAKFLKFMYEMCVIVISPLKHHLRKVHFGLAEHVSEGFLEAYHTVEKFGADAHIFYKDFLYVSGGVAGFVSQLPDLDLAGSFDDALDKIIQQENLFF